MSSRYLLFAGITYYPDHGAHCIAARGDDADLLAKLGPEIENGGWWHVYDLHAHKVLSGVRTSPVASRPTDEGLDGCPAEAPVGGPGGVDAVVCCREGRDHLGPHKCGPLTWSTTTVWLDE